MSMATDPSPCRSTPRKTQVKAARSPRSSRRPGAGKLAAATSWLAGAHFEREHLPPSEAERRRHGNAIGQVQLGARQRHQPDLDLVGVRRHEVDAAIAGTEAR